MAAYLASDVSEVDRNRTSEELFSDFVKLYADLTTYLKGGHPRKPILPWQARAQADYYLYKKGYYALCLMAYLIIDRHFLPRDRYMTTIKNLTLGAQYENILNHSRFHHDKETHEVPLFKESRDMFGGCPAHLIYIIEFFLLHSSHANSDYNIPHFIRGKLDRLTCDRCVFPHDSLYTFL